MQRQDTDTDMTEIRTCISTLQQVTGMFNSDI